MFHFWFDKLNNVIIKMIKECVMSKLLKEKLDLKEVKQIFIDGIMNACRY